MRPCACGAARRGRTGGGVHTLRLGRLPIMSPLMASEVIIGFADALVTGLTSNLLSVSQDPEEISGSFHLQIRRILSLKIGRNTTYNGLIDKLSAVHSSSVAKPKSLGVVCMDLSSKMDRVHSRSSTLKFHATSWTWPGGGLQTAPCPRQPIRSKFIVI